MSQGRPKGASAYRAKRKKKKNNKKERPASKFPHAMQDAGHDRRTSQKWATQDAGLDSLTQKTSKTEKS